MKTKVSKDIAKSKNFQIIIEEEISYTNFTTCKMLLAR